MNTTMTLRARIAITIAITLAALIALFAGMLYSERQTLLNGHQAKIRNLVEVAHGVVSFNEKAAKEGRMSEEDAKKAAMTTIRTMRYDQDEYFWINDMTPRVVMHTAKPELEGKDMGQLKDPNGKELYNEFVAVVKKNGAGLVDYYWPKPGSNTPVAKLSYVKGFAPWGWVIGTGIYIDDVNAAFVKGAINLGIGGALVITLMTIPLLMLRRSVVRSLGGEPAQAAEIANRVAAGDMTGTIALADGDTTSLLAAVSTMQENLRNMIREVTSEAERVAQQSHAMQVASDQFTLRFEAQSDSTQQIAAAVEEMSVGIDEIARRTQEAHGLAHEAGTLAGDGCRVINDTTEGIDALASTVNSSSQKIRELEKFSEEISSVVNTIREIADQTNLLALNAAIEAARAGEQGRGFAVVADEVRKLAERTSLSTTEIANTVTRIQDGTHQAVESMSSGVTHAAQGVELSRQAGAAIAQIRTGAERVSETLQGITGAVREQSTAGQSIAQGVESIAHMTEQNVDEAKRSAAIARDLQALSAALHTSIGRFKV